MPIISKGDRGGWSGRLSVWLIYIVLTVGGASMAYPFLVTLTGSISSGYDYYRRSPYPLFLFSRNERMMRTLCLYYPPEKRTAIKELRSAFPSWPGEWVSWKQAGDGPDKAAVWAGDQLARLDAPDQAATIKQMAADYHDFALGIPLENCTVGPDSRYMAPFLRDRYPSLAAFNKAWEMAVDDFVDVPQPPGWVNEAYYHQSHLTSSVRRYEDLLALRQLYRENHYLPFLADDPQAMSLLQPAGLAFTWETYAGSELGLDYEQAHDLPFPVPTEAPESLRNAWHNYLVDYFPLRYVTIPLSPERQTAYTHFLSQRFLDLGAFNRLISEDVPDWTPISRWEELTLTTTMPSEGPLAKLWLNFVKETLPPEQWIISDQLPEKAFQVFALQKYGSLAAVNAAYGRDLPAIENLRIPYREAFLVTFDAHEWAFTRHLMSRNYKMVLDYLILRGRAVFNTVVLVVLALIMTLTVNPLAGYALSRFRLPQTEKILIFCLATMAFPAAVAAIPGFLLLRDLSLLNTFAALVLPGAANGMGIFLLKGFFDSLPQELYEAATIDGAPEWQIFVRISLPLVKPILAVNLLNAFIAAYSGWAWAIIVCQDPSMWTMAVWTYQFSQLFAAQPFAVMAAYMITSLPVFVVFLLCQNIIMRGIILPQMK